MRYVLTIFITLLSISLLFPPVITAENFITERKKLIAEIEDHAHATRHYIDKETLSRKVMEALGQIPRHEFVPKEQIKNAYLNRPLPIGHGQTISQPFIVALMTDFLSLTPSSKVLEIGTGSGYQAAVLSVLAEKVYSLEIIEPLATQATKRFQQLGMDNITTKVGDGYYGWEEHGPYDGIMVTAAADHVPPPLLKQLKPGARMVIPVGSRFQTQQLLLIQRVDEKSYTTRQILPVIFVPLTGDH